MYRKTNSRFAAIVAAILLIICPGEAWAQTKYLTDMAPAPAVSDTDTLFWCSVATPGCDSSPSHALTRQTALAIANYVTGKIALPPVPSATQLLGGNGTAFNTVTVSGDRNVCCCVHAFA